MPGPASGQIPLDGPRLVVEERPITEQGTDTSTREKLEAEVDVLHTASHEDLDTLMKTRTEDLEDALHANPALMGLVRNRVDAIMDESTNVNVSQSSRSTNPQTSGYSELSPSQESEAQQEHHPAYYEPKLSEKEATDKTQEGDAILSLEAEDGEGKNKAKEKAGWEAFLLRRIAQLEEEREMEKKEKQRFRIERRMQLEDEIESVKAKLRRMPRAHEVKGSRENPIYQRETVQRESIQTPRYRVVEVSPRDTSGSAITEEGEWIPLSHEDTVKVTPRTVVDNTDADADARHVRSDLRVPPFLIWPTNEDLDQHFRTSNDLHADHGRVGTQDDSTVQITLTRIEQSLRKSKQKDRALPVKPDHPFVKDLCEGNILPKLPEVLTDAVLPPDWSIEAGRLAAETAASETLLHWQVLKLKDLHIALVGDVKRLIDHFVPVHYPHPLLRRCWGALSRITSVIDEVFAQCNELIISRSSNGQVLQYVIREPNEEAFILEKALSRPILAIEDCPVCYKDRRYSSREAAIRHLSTDHFPAQADDDSRHPSEAALAAWLVPNKELSLEETNSELIEIQSVLHGRVVKLLAKTSEIRSSVANENTEMSSRYLLPSDLVKAAECIFQFVFAAAYAVQEVQAYLKYWSSSAPINHTPHLVANRSLPEYYARAADSSLVRTRNELLLMAVDKTNGGTSVIRQMALTPPTVVLLSLDTLSEGRLANGLNVVALYRHHVSRLRLEAGRNPSKKIFRELHLLQEELDIVNSVIEDQFKAFLALETVLNPDTYRIVNRVRIEAFESVESRTLSGIKKAQKRMANDFRHLDQQISKTAQVLRYNIEIAEEGQNKAILVFTIVTIVFLPLSFVATLLGMNTTDIRSMNRNQSLFWEIALPLTTCIAVGSLLVAYKGSKMGEQLGSLRQNLSIKRKRRSTMLKEEYSQAEKEVLPRWTRGSATGKGKVHDSSLTECTVVGSAG